METFNYLDYGFGEAFIDIDEVRSDRGQYRYVHGGFLDSEIRFSFYFPMKEVYKGRFFHFLLPIAGSENSSEGEKEEQDRIRFALSHGAYFVESNMGGANSVGEMIFKSSAVSAQYSRVVAEEYYGKHYPYGYVFGGSGGGFKTMSCVQSTQVWDGSVPFVIGSPMAIPNVFTVRAHAFRILRHKMDRIVEAFEPDGDQSVFKDLNEEEREAFDEVSKMGFPKKVWFAYRSMGFGALPIFINTMEMLDPSYFTDFWEKEGYLGFEKDSSACRDRIQHKTVIRKLQVHGEGDFTKVKTKAGVDDAWQKMKSIDISVFQPWLEVDGLPPEDAYLDGAVIRILTGSATGEKLPLHSIKEHKLMIGEGYNQSNMLQILEQLKVGDEIMVDNSNFIALQTYHRHQVPDASYKVFDQFRKEDGSPKYPQRPILVGPMLAGGGAGSVQDGSFHGKMIVVAALMDESAFPWQAAWYHELVKKKYAEETTERFRLWFMDHAMHGDHDKEPDTLRVSGYIQAVYQALLDVSAWVEKGIAPPGNTNYQVKDGQVIVAETASERGGIQPTVKLIAKHEKEIRIGDEVEFEAFLQVPKDSGYILSAEWSFDNTTCFESVGEATLIKDTVSEIRILQKHRFTKAGRYHVVVRVKAQRHGSSEDSMTHIINIDRVRVLVKEN